MNDIALNAPVFDKPLVQGQADPSAPVGGELGQETFLRLLTEQMQNQDPLDPQKNEDFVAQLAQFSSLEQLVGLQSTMEGVYLAMASMNNSSMANLLGTDVVAVGDGVHYSGQGDATLHFDTPQNLNGGTITITDEDGTVINTLPVSPQSAGEFEVVWDGTDQSGQVVEEGNYTFKISATDTDGNSVEVQTLVVGMVDEMDYASGTPQPSIDGIVVGLDAILRLTRTDPQEVIP